jgi:hypothetical protein
VNLRLPDPPSDGNSILSLLLEANSICPTGPSSSPPVTGEQAEKTDRIAIKAIVILFIRSCYLTQKDGT